MPCVCRGCLPTDVLYKCLVCRSCLPTDVLYKCLVCVGAVFLQMWAQRFHGLYDSCDNSGGKELDNLLVLLAQLCNFKVCHLEINRYLSLTCLNCFVKLNLNKLGKT